MGQYTRGRGRLGGWVVPHRCPTCAQSTRAPRPERSPPAQPPRPQARQCAAAHPSPGVLEGPAGEGEGEEWRGGGRVRRPGRRSCRVARVRVRDSQRECRRAALRSCGLLLRRCLRACVRLPARPSTLTHPTPSSRRPQNRVYPAVRPPAVPVAVRWWLRPRCCCHCRAREAGSARPPCRFAGGPGRVTWSGSAQWARAGPGQLNPSRPIRVGADVLGRVPEQHLATPSGRCPVCERAVVGGELCYREKTRRLPAKPIARS